MSRDQIVKRLEDDKTAQIEALIAENERLRAALKTISQDAWRALRIVVVGGDAAPRDETEVGGTNEDISYLVDEPARGGDAA